VPAAADVAHLLRRAGFGGTASEITTFAAQPLATTVDQLLDFSAAPPDSEPAFLSDGTLGDWEKEFKLQAWWLDRMVTTTTPLQERLAFFWHGHFATANRKVDDALLMYRQNALFRQLAAGNFRDLVQQMALQPAMVIWLDNDANVEGSPNENFARELMELFTVGVNQYTQPDIAASARAWTGHNTLDSDRRQYHFYAARHDTGNKTFMGVTRNWDGPEIIDHLLRDDATKKRVAARYVAKKLWSFFAYPNPETAVLDALETAFFNADLDITALVRAIFNHPQFMSPAAKQGLVRSPVEWVVACLRGIGMTADDTNPQWWMPEMGQHLFEPPNVAGWDQNAYWLGTMNVWARANWARYVTWKARDAGVLDTALGSTPGMTVAGAIDAAYALFRVGTPGPATRTRLMQWLTSQRADTNAWADWAFIDLLTLMMISPDMNVA
jgi:uncharacterized protein (DUF1800 family)